MHSVMPYEGITETKRPEASENVSRMSHATECSSGPAALATKRSANKLLSELKLQERRKKDPAKARKHLLERLKLLKDSTSAARVVGKLTGALQNRSRLPMQLLAWSTPIEAVTKKYETPLLEHEVELHQTGKWAEDQLGLLLGRLSFDLRSQFAKELSTWNNILSLAELAVLSLSYLHSKYAPVASQLPSGRRSSPLQRRSGSMRAPPC